MAIILYNIDSIGEFVGVAKVFVHITRNRSVFFKNVRLWNLIIKAAEFKHIIVEVESDKLLFGKLCAM